VMFITINKILNWTELNTMYWGTERDLPCLAPLA